MGVEEIPKVMCLSLIQLFVLAESSKKKHIHLCEDMQRIVLPMVNAGLMELISEDMETMIWKPEITFLGEIVSRSPGMYFSSEWNNELLN